MSYNLSSGPFGLCAGYWDEKDQIFRTATKTEEGECCINGCKPFVKECRELCKKSSTPDILETCYNTCDDVQKLCQDNCQLSSKLWGANNPIYKATKKFGCGNGFETPVNKTCAIQHKDEILRDCAQNCITMPTLNCKEHCEYSFGLISGEEKNPLDIGKDTMITKKSIQNKLTLLNDNDTRYNCMLYVVYAFALSVIIFGLYIMFRVYKK